MNAYELSGLPSKAAIVTQLLTNEIQDKLARKGVVGDTQFILTGLQLEEDQYVSTSSHTGSPLMVFRNHIRHLIKNKSQPKTITAACNHLQTALDHWRTIQYSQYPSLEGYITSTDPCSVENEKLLLPSLFNEAFRQSLGVSHIAHIEYQLCEGSTHDALNNICLLSKSSITMLGLRK